MRYILSRVAAALPAFGRRPLTFEDFEVECVRRKIHLLQAAFRRLHGCAWTDSDGAFICLAENLPIQAKTLAGFHELGHHLLHATESTLLMSRGDLTNRARWEAEAAAVATIALVPFLPIITDYGCHSDLEAHRLELWKNYGV